VYVWVPWLVHTATNLYGLGLVLVQPHRIHQTMDRRIEHSACRLRARLHQPGLSKCPSTGFGKPIIRVKRPNRLRQAADLYGQTTRQPSAC
jgi:hypothetical protein